MGSIHWPFLTWFSFGSGKAKSRSILIVPMFGFGGEDVWCHVILLKCGLRTTSSSNSQTDMPRLADDIVGSNQRGPMKDLFLRRNRLRKKVHVSYLRYVLNDHWILFLLVVLIGFLCFQYSQLLQDFHKIIRSILLFWECICLALAQRRNHDLHGSTWQALSLSIWRGGSHTSKGERCVHWFSGQCSNTSLLLFAPDF